MVIFDASVLIDLFNIRLKDDRRAKLDQLVETLQKKRTTILIPTPALSEFMARAGSARDEYFRKLNSSSNFRIAPYGAKAAMECALMIDEALTGGDKKANAKTWAKAKFDWQIVAIAKSENATAIYSEDADIVRLGKRANIFVIKTEELPLPASARQHSMDFNPE
jgi:predicted nucleic acid-binding protein